MIPSVKDLNISEWKSDSFNTQQKLLKIKGTNILVGCAYLYSNGNFYLVARFSNVFGGRLKLINLTAWPSDEELTKMWEKSMEPLLKKLFK